MSCDLIVLSAIRWKGLLKNSNVDMQQSIDENTNLEFAWKDIYI